MSGATRPLLSVPQVMERFNVSKSWVHDQCAAKKLPHYKIERQLRFDPDEIELYLRERYRPVDKTPARVPQPRQPEPEDPLADFPMP